MARSTLSSLAAKWLVLTYPLLNGCALVLEYPLTSASVGVWGTTGKGPTDHAVSYALNEDCEALRAINSEPICKKTSDVAPDVVDKSFNLEAPKNPVNTRSVSSSVASPAPSPRSIKTKPSKKTSQQKSNKTQQKLK
jgi:hypothetical protein